MMVGTYTVCISFSDITIRFRFPAPVQLMPEFQALACGDSGDAGAEYEVRLLREPLRPAGTPISTNRGNMILYATESGWLRVYPLMTAEDGCQVACLLRPNGKNVLYYPASQWDHYSAPLRCMHLIGGEVLLLERNAFLLHSSVVLHQGRTVLFSGPSGAGKSTQAEWWERYTGAKVLNGDRCVVMKKEDGFYGGGSPWSGTSGIYHPEQAPIAGIFLVHQAPENSVQRLGFEAFTPLLTQTTVNSWDPPFMDKVTGLIAELLSQVPVYRLNCRPDEEAVRLAHHTLF